MKVVIDPGIIFRVFGQLRPDRHCEDIANYVRHDDRHRLCIDARQSILKAYKSQIKKPDGKRPSQAKKEYEKWISDLLIRKGKTIQVESQLPPLLQHELSKESQIASNLELISVAISTGAHLIVEDTLKERIVETVVSLPVTSVDRQDRLHLLHRTLDKEEACKALQEPDTTEAAQPHVEETMTRAFTFASTFLSHSSTDKPLVEAVARALGQRGVLSWLDKSDLEAGDDLQKAIKEAISRQATVTFFLSPDSVRSGWVEKEIRVALDEHERHPQRVIPVFLGKREELVRSHPVLRASHWVLPDGEVNQLGIESTSAVNIAEGIATSVYSSLSFASKAEVIIYLNQRLRQEKSEPELPDSFKNIDAPVLVVRPDLNSGSMDEVISGAAWTEMRTALRWTLHRALGNVAGPKTRKIYIAGNSQLALSYLLGQYFNRNTLTHLFCLNRLDAQVYTNKDQERGKPMEGGKPKPTETFPDEIQQAETLSLFLLRKDGLPAARRHVEQQEKPTPMVWIEHGIFTNNNEVIQYIRDVVVVLSHLNEKFDIKCVNLYSTLPNAVMPILAANLLHVARKVVFMEYCRNADPKYIALETGME